MTRRASLAAVTALFVIASSVGWWGTGRAQSEELDFNRDVLPAVVQISVRIVEREAGKAEEQFLPRGSGTVITPTGLVLTSAHVLGVADVVASAAAQEAKYSSEGRQRTVRVTEGQYVLGFSEQGEPPAPRYTAKPVVVDAVLDLAVLRITGGVRNQPVAVPELPFLTLGDSDLVRHRQPIEVIGYPGIAEAIFVDDGIVNTLETEPGVDGWAWFITDAEVSGGSSGGAAVDAAGRLIGVTTLATELECRPGDVNGDGEVNEADVGCVPVGDSAARLRPINLAKPLLQDVPEYLALAPTPTVEPVLPTSTLTPTPVPTPTPTPTPNPTLPTVAVPTETPTAAAPVPTWTPVPARPTVASDPNDAQALRALLPEADEAPPGLVLSGERQRTLAEVSQVFTDPEATFQLFQELGWRANVFRQFTAATPNTLSPFEVDFARIGIQRFGSADQSMAAAEHIAEDTLAGIGGSSTLGPDIGDGGMTVSGQNENGYWVNILVANGPDVISVSTSSPRANPYPAALDLAEAVLARATSQDGAQDASGGSLADLLPVEGEVPLGLIETQDVTRTLEQASRVYSDPADMVQRYTDWGWQENVLRVFGSAAGAGSQELSYLAVTIHAFASDAAASQALDYALEDEVAAFRHQEIGVPQLGDRSRGIAGTSQGANETVIYVQSGERLIVVDAISPSGDPTSDAVAVARVVAAR